MKNLIKLLAVAPLSGSVAMPTSSLNDATIAPTKKLGVVVVTGNQPTSLPTHISTTM